MNFLAFFSYAITACISPGPNAVISLSNSNRYRLRKSLTFNLGISVGVLAVLLLCSVFSFTLLSVFPSLKEIMKWGGAAYIVYLAWQTYKSTPINDEEISKQGNLFIQGLILQFANPNTILYGLTVFSNFIVPHYKLPVMIVLFCLLLSLIAFMCTACWTLFGSVFKKIVIKYSKAVNTVMALLLVYCAVSIVL